MGYIYVVENKINNKKYIGQTLQLDINKRWNQHKRNNGIGKILLNAYEKYGVDNFRFRIICICFDDDTNRYETEYIKKYNTLYPNGYNLLEGGNNKKHNEYTINILKQKLTGNNHPNYGKIFSEEQRKNMSNSKTGLLNPNYGKKLSNEQKEKIKQTIKKFDKEKRELINNKISESIKKSIKNRKAVIQYDINNNLINKHNSITEASKLTNISRRTIQRCCDGVYKNAKGFVWKYED